MGGGQGDANLRVWPLADFFDSVTRICARRIVGKQEGDSLLEKLHSQIQLATSPENNKGVSWKTGKVIGINRSGQGIGSSFSINVQYGVERDSTDLEENIFPGRIRKSFDGPIHVGDIVKVQNEKTLPCEIIDIKHSQYDISLYSVRMENGSVEDNVQESRLRHIDSNEPLHSNGLGVGKQVRIVENTLASGLADLLDLYDYDGNGEVSHYEFLTLLQDGLGLQISSEDAGILCRRLDKDGDGTISIKELRGALVDLEFEKSKDNISSIKCAHVLKGHTGSITALEYSDAQQLVVSSSTDGTVRIWDAGAQLYRLSHPGQIEHVQRWPGYYKKMDSEWTKTSMPFMEALVLKLGDNMYCRALSTLNLNLEPPPCSIRLDENSIDKCIEIDFTTKTSKPIDEASIATERPEELHLRCMQFANSSDSGRCKGFVYLLKSGNAYCIEAASGFRTEMVLHEDTAFIESFPNPLVRPRLHWLHRRRHLIMRVFYVVSDEYGSIQSFMEAFTKSGNHLRKLINIEKFCMRPHANIVVFYGPNDGDTIIKKIGKEKVQTFGNSENDRAKNRSAKLGTVTKVIAKQKWYEVAYDHAQIETRVQFKRIKLKTIGRRSAILQRKG